MKKTLTICGAVLGVLLIAVLVIFIFFPGLPEYFKVKKDYKYIDRTIGSFDKADVPVSFSAHTIRGVKLSAPMDFTENDRGSALKNSSGDTAVFIIELDSVQSAQYADAAYEDAGDSWFGHKYSESDYRSFFDKIDAEYPDPEEAKTDILWFFRDGFTAKDCIRLRGRDMDIFKELAEDKEKAWETEDTWKMSGEGFEAYVCQSSVWTVTIYPDGGGSKYISIMLNHADDDTIRQIISSIELE